jgi:hypothetical protein
LPLALNRQRKQMKLKLAVVLLMVTATALGFFVGRFHAGSMFNTEMQSTN